MSIELIALVISTATMLLGFVGVVGWLVNRMDKQSERLVEHIDTVEQRLGSRIDSVERGLGARIDSVEHELVDVKVALARLEGPGRHMLLAR